jgi:hypothetical protein
MGKVDSGNHGDTLGHCLAGTPVICVSYAAEGDHTVVNRMPMAMGDIPECLGLVEAVQSLAIEESPLWEVLEDVDSRVPHKTEVERLDIAAWAVSELLIQGVVQLVWTRWTATGIERRVVTAEENAAILSGPHY